jgi:hypothetical protein
MEKFCAVEIKKVEIKKNEEDKPIIKTEYSLVCTKRYIRKFDSVQLKAWLNPQIAAKGGWSFRAFEIADKKPGLERVCAAILTDMGYVLVEDGYGEMKMFFTSEEVDMLYEEHWADCREDRIVFLKPVEGFGCRSYTEPHPK